MNRRANRVERMTLDVPLLRADTPGVANVLHFNNAGAALPPRPVLDAVTGHLAREAAIGGYEAAAEAEGRIADVYDAVATLIGARRDEIAFVESATRAWDMVVYAVPFRAGDRVVTARAEYLSNYLAFLQMKARAGIEIDVVEGDASGQLDLKALERAIGSAYQADRDYARADARRARQSGGRGRPYRRAPRHSLSARCPLVGRPARGRCAADRLPHARGPGPQVSARAPRHGLPVRAA